MYTVYILQSLKNKRHYIGHAENVAVRLAQHNAQRVRSTKLGVPWKIVYKEVLKTRSEACRREKEIKSYKGGVEFHALLNGTLRKR